MGYLIGVAIVFWAIVFAAVHGPFVFGYLALHAVTTGVFLLVIRRTDRKHENERPVATVRPTKAVASSHSNDRAARPQPAA